MHHASPRGARWSPRRLFHSGSRELDWALANFSARDPELTRAYDSWSMPKLRSPTVEHSNVYIGNLPAGKEADNFKRHVAERYQDSIESSRYDPYKGHGFLKFSTIASPTNMARDSFCHASRRKWSSSSQNSWTATSWRGWWRHRCMTRTSHP